MVRTKKLSRWGKSKKFSHPFCLPHLNTWWMPDDADFCLPPVVNKTVFFPGLFCACFCYTLFCESGSWSRNKECILFCQAFPQRFSILSIMMTWIMMFFFFFVFQVCFIFLHFPYYVNAKSRCLLLHLILFVFVIKTIYIYISLIRS